MKSSHPSRAPGARGITLLELTVVLCVLMTLLGITFIASSVWKKGAQRGECIMTLYSVQLAVRSYQNLSGAEAGGHPTVAYGTYDIARHLLEKGYIGGDLYSAAVGEKTCQGGGTYDRPDANVFPKVGDLYLECSLAGDGKHAPDSHASW
ncbi:hypothetical protein [Luteolibacter sp. LG18]|uniref:type II secretion system protein n=1 Tax=Luteolibacter sp. LG18 TaxID=2819286 RepID=UPI002B28EE52|nr:hypothetical protein llg_10740 [Luteolibacter sp. LG18]